MALADPYAPCPCGSDKKYKWCCQKAESYLERAQRLAETKQFEAAVGVLNEGLAKHPEIPGLQIRKAILLGALKRPQEARECCAAVLRQLPEHPAATTLLIRLTMLAEGLVAGAAELHRALARSQPGQRSRLGRIAVIVGTELAKNGRIPAALKHLEMAQAIGNGEEILSLVESGLASLRQSDAYPPWLKERYALSPAPEHLAPPSRERFDQALAWADEGLFETAASAFELLTSDPAASAAAERNLGLCRLWMGDHAAAAEALGRYMERAGATEEAVDLRLLCQRISPIEDPEPVELVQLSWPLRDRAALGERLAADPCIVEGGARPRDPEDEDSPEVPCFHWLDRPRIEARSGLAPDQIPHILADILVGDDHVAIETYDDGRLNELIDRFVAMAGHAVPPAHPRTRVVRRVRRSEHALSWRWQLPEDLPDAEVDRLAIEQSSHIASEVWPSAPSELFGGLTPLQAARTGKYEVALRAELLRLESSTGDGDGHGVDWRSVRERLGIPEEPRPDPRSVDVEQMPLGRLALLSVRELDDDRLARLYERAREYGLHRVVLRAAHEILNRSAEGFEGKIDPVGVHQILAEEASARGNLSEALEWLNHGRTWGNPRRRAELAPHWDILEVVVRAEHEPPEKWVPDLALLLERYMEHESAGRILTARLIDMGLLRVESLPDQPGELMVDSRPLYQLLSEYGPRVTTSAGYLGISATKGEIWTPDSPAQGSSAIWTPGSDAGPAAEKPRIIVTGS